MPGPVVYDTLSRFIFDKRHFSSSKRVAKRTAFNDPSLRLSVFWIDDLQEQEIWHIGDTVAGGPRERRTLARADFNKLCAHELKLTIEPDPKPHPRHAELCGWPKEKDERMAITLELCNRSQLRLRDS